MLCLYIREEEEEEEEEQKKKMMKEEEKKKKKEEEEEEESHPHLCYIEVSFFLQHLSFYLLVSVFPV